MTEKSSPTGGDFVLAPVLADFVADPDAQEAADCRHKDCPAAKAIAVIHDRAQPTA